MGEDGRQEADRYEQEGREVGEMESVQERMERLGTKEKIATFMQKEKQPYEFKRKYAQIRAEEFASECDGRGLNYHVSVGGLDSMQHVWVWNPHRETPSQI